MLASIIDAKKLPGSPGDDSAAAVASPTEFDTPRVLYVTTAGTFSFKTKGGTTRTAVPLPVGVYPVYLRSLTAIDGGGAGELIIQ